MTQAMHGSAITLDIGNASTGGGERCEEELPALLLAWADAGHDHVGAVALFDAGGGAQILGRGNGDGARVQFYRQRPGVLESVGPIVSPGISREQLRVRREGERLLVERIGRCPLEFRGELVDRCMVGPGDTILLRSQLLLYGTRRPRRLSPLVHVALANVHRFGEPDGCGIVGESPVAWRLREQLTWLGAVDQHTLVLGASGSGKELCARAIHALSRRASGPFVARNAATIPRDLVDAELFGNVKGYPNPGMPERPGLIGAADGGTLFLDEIGELPHHLQASLLRVLDEGGEYHRLGAATVSRSRFRLMGATNREIGALKHDLAARLVLRIGVPGIDQRRDDIPLLARHLLRRAAVRNPEATARFGTGSGAPDLRTKPRLVRHLLEISYPTNLREMDARLWQSMAASTGDAITWCEDARAIDPGDPGDDDMPRRAENDATLAPEPSPDQIRASLAEYGGNVVRTAQALGLTSRYVLYRLMRKHGIEG